PAPTGSWSCRTGAWSTRAPTRRSCGATAPTPARGRCNRPARPSRTRAARWHVSDAPASEARREARDSRGKSRSFALLDPRFAPFVRPHYRTLAAVLVLTLLGVVAGL